MSRRDRDRVRSRRRSKSRSRSRSRNRNRYTTTEKPRDKREDNNDFTNNKKRFPTGLKQFDFEKYENLINTATITKEIQPNKRAKKNRWGPTEDDKVVIPGIPLTMPQNLTLEQEKIYLLQLEIEELSRRLRTNDLGIPANPAERSPSPEPLYNNEGIRTNTREVRIKARLDMQRHELVLKMFTLNPEYKPPSDYRPPTIRFNDKVFLPQDEYPDINFVGLLIGPRGSTLKQLEKETNAKIIIRGRGSVKDGKMGGKREGISMPGEDEFLHAWITAPTEEILTGARKKIQEVIQQGIDIPDADNDLRKQQLRELALINGTLQENDGLAKLRTLSEIQSIATNNIICGLCGGTGHLAIDCKRRREFDIVNNFASDAMDGGSFENMMLQEEPVPPGVTPTNTCTSIVRIGTGSGLAHADRRKMDNEYTALMSELGVPGDRLASAYVDPTMAKIRMPQGVNRNYVYGGGAAQQRPLNAANEYNMNQQAQINYHQQQSYQPQPPGMSSMSATAPPPPPPPPSMGYPSHIRIPYQPTMTSGMCVPYSHMSYGIIPPPPPAGYGPRAPPMPPRPPAPPGYNWQPPMPPAPPQLSYPSTGFIPPPPGN